MFLVSLTTFLVLLQIWSGFSLESCCAFFHTFKVWPICFTFTQVLDSCAPFTSSFNGLTPQTYGDGTQRLSASASECKEAITGDHPLLVFNSCPTWCGDQTFHKTSEGQEDQKIRRSERHNKHQQTSTNPWHTSFGITNTQHSFFATSP